MFVIFHNHHKYCSIFFEESRRKRKKKSTLYFEGERERDAGFCDGGYDKIRQSDRSYM